MDQNPTLSHPRSDYADLPHSADRTSPRGDCPETGQASVLVRVCGSDRLHRASKQLDRQLLTRADDMEKSGRIVCPERY